jgi:3-oxoadipate enol-lactonase
MSFVTVSDGCRIAYRFEGASAERARPGGVLLLSNSLGTNTQLWAPQLAAFAARFRVLCYDSRGHGASDAPSGAYSIDRLGRDVVELLDAVGLQSVHFCGLSQGGMVGQWLGAHAAERIERLVLANTAAYVGPPSAWQDRIDRVLEAGMSVVVAGVLERWFTPGFAARAPQQVAALRAIFLSTSPVGYAGCCAALRDLDLRGSAASVSAPTLIVAGALDPATPPERAAELAGKIPTARVVTLDAAHLSNVEQAESFNQVVLEFLEAHPRC